MKQSRDVTAAVLRFYDRLSAGDVSSFDAIVSSDPATLVIGTAPGEWVTERAKLRYGFEAEGATIRAGTRAAGYESGDLGWFFDDPVFTFPGVGEVETRLTAVVAREEGQWRLVHFHASVGVPDEEVVELQRRWSAAG